MLKNLEHFRLNVYMMRRGDRERCIDSFIHKALKAYFGLHACLAQSLFLKALPTEELFFGKFFVTRLHINAAN